MEGYPMGINFNSAGVDNWNLIIEGSSSPSQPAVSTEAKKEEVKGTISINTEVPKVAVQPVKKAKKREFLGQTYNISNF